MRRLNTSAPRSVTASADGSLSRQAGTGAHGRMRTDLSSHRDSKGEPASAVSRFATVAVAILLPLSVGVAIAQSRPSCESNGLEVSSAYARVTSDREPQSTIGEITVEGNRVLNAAAIIVLSGHRVGDLCSAEVLADMRDRLAKSGNFGMHYPDKPDQWVKVHAEGNGEGKCKVTISVDENDRVTSIEVTGTGPISSDEVRAMITKTNVWNVEQLAADAQSILDLYHRRGYEARIPVDMSRPSSGPGTLVIPLEVTRLDSIVILRDGVPDTRARLPRRLMTRPGDYFNSKTFYEVDRKRLSKSRLFKNAKVFEKPVGTARIQLQIELDPNTKDRR